MQPSSGHSSPVDSPVYGAGLAKGESGLLVPSMDLLIGRALRYTSIVRFIMWFPNIASLEGY